MKKIGFVLLIIAVIAIALIYILIPNNIIVSRIAYVHIKPAGAARCLQDDNKWPAWFPGKVARPSILNYNSRQYQLGKKEYRSAGILISDKNSNYESIINVIPLAGDSSAIQWQFQFVASKNPVTRIKQYQSANNITSDMTIILDSFKMFIQDTKNIYGFTIKRTTLTDTALVSVKTSTKKYPSTQLIYSLVNMLKAYITAHQAVQHNYPMLNIIQLKDSSYEVMVGVPTNILLEGKNAIQPKRMIMLKDKTIVTEVTGDNKIIKKALEATNNFLDDNDLSTPVIPFQLLITDRSKVQDSTKWITKIFTPII